MKKAVCLLSVALFLLSLLSIARGAKKFDDETIVRRATWYLGGARTYETGPLKGKSQKEIEFRFPEFPYHSFTAYCNDWAKRLQDSGTKEVTLTLHRYERTEDFSVNGWALPLECELTTGIGCGETDRFGPCKSDGSFDPGVSPWKKKSP